MNQNHQIQTHMDTLNYHLQNNGTARGIYNSCIKLFLQFSHDLWGQLDTEEMGLKYNLQ